MKSCQLMKYLKQLSLALATGLCLSSTAHAGITHLYTFNNGTANDSVGGANGTLEGNATVSGGQLVLDGTSTTYLDLPGPTIGINTYSALTLELWLNSSSANTNNFTMAAAFGRTFSGASDPLSQSNGGPFADSDTWRGVQYIMMQPTRGDGHSRAAITALSYEAESGVNGPGQIDDGLQHMMALTVDATDISYYIDGALIGSAPLGGTNTLATVSNDHAYLGQSVFPGDPHFAGSINQFSIYNNALSSSQIAADYATGPVPVPEPGTASLLLLGGAALLRRRRKQNA